MLTMELYVFGDILSVKLWGYDPYIYIYPYISGYHKSVCDKKRICFIDLRIISRSIQHQRYTIGYNSYIMGG